MSLATNKITRCLILLPAFSLAACSTLVSPTVLPTVPTLARPTRVPTGTMEPTTVTAQPASPTPLPATVTPASTGIPLDLVVPELVAVEPGRTIFPPDMSKPYSEYGILVYAPPITAPVFSLSKEGTSYGRSSFSPDGQWMVYEEIVEGQGRLRLVSTDWQTDRPLTDWFEASLVTLMGVSKVLWSPDGRWLAFEYSDWGYRIRNVYLVNMNSGKMLLVGEQVVAFDWSTAGPLRLAFSIEREDESSLYVALVEDGEHWQPEEVRGFRRGEEVHTLAWQPHGNLLLISTSTPDLGSIGWPEERLYKSYLLDLSSRTQIELPVREDFGESWLPDGRRLAYCGDEICSLYDIEQEAFVQDVPVIPDGEWFREEIVVFSEQTDPDDYKEYILVARSVRSGEEKILWRTVDVDLDADAGFEVYSISGLSWHVDMHP